MLNYDICTLFEGLCELEKDESLSFKAKTSFQLAKNKAALEPYYKLVKKCERDIWLQFGEQDEEGRITINNSKVGEANKALEDLMNVETEVNLAKIDISEFDGMNIPMNVFSKLINIIKE